MLYSYLCQYILCVTSSYASISQACLTFMKRGYIYRIDKTFKRGLIMEIAHVKIWQTDGTFRHGSIYINNGLFASSSEDDIIIDGKNAYALPGLVDLHFHGAMGHDLSDGSYEALEAICNYELSQGITTICPASMSLPEEDLVKVMEVVKKGCESGACLAGIHMEGPFFSQAKKGAQKGDYLKSPQIDFYKRLQEASGNAIRIVSLAPELEHAFEFAKEVQGSKDKVVLSVAHTDASYECVAKALEEGFSHFTHFYNGMTGFTHRLPGAVGAGLECEGEHTAELICDGIHLHPAAVRLVFKVLGKERVIFVSDSMRAVGLSDGEYNLGGQTVTVKGNEARLTDGTIAGSATSLADCVRVAVNEVKIPLGDAILCASANPAKKLGLYDKIGSIEEGKIADLLLWNENLETVAIYHKGKEILK